MSTPIDRVVEAARQLGIELEPPEAAPAAGYGAGTPNAPSAADEPSTRGERPALADPGGLFEELNGVRIIRQPDGTLLIDTRSTGAPIILQGGSQGVDVRANGARVQIGASGDDVQMRAEGAVQTHSDADSSVDADGNLSLTSDKDAALSGKTKVLVTSDAEVYVTAPRVAIRGTSVVRVASGGTMVLVASGSMAIQSSARVVIRGDAGVSIVGGLRPVLLLAPGAIPPAGTVPSSTMFG